MRTAVSIQELEELLRRQLYIFQASDVPQKSIEEALKRVEKSFTHIRNKYFSQKGEAYFDPFHSAQYAQFLYYLSNTVYHHGDPRLAAKLYYLNKMLNSVDWYYEVELPSIFFADHPLGSIMGRAKYSDRFVFLQGCSVGQNKNVYPTIGENVLMHPNSCIFGNCNIGENVEIAAQTVIIDQDIPANSIVFGRSPNLVIRRKTAENMRSRLQMFFYEDEMKTVGE